MCECSPTNTQWRLAGLLLFRESDRGFPGTYANASERNTGKLPLSWENTCFPVLERRGRSGVFSEGPQNDGMELSSPLSKGCELEMFSLEMVLATLLWVALPEQGLHHMDPEVPANFSHAMIPRFCAGGALLSAALIPQREKQQCCSHLQACRSPCHGAGAGHTNGSLLSATGYRAN